MIKINSYDIINNHSNIVEEIDKQLVEDKVALSRAISLNEQYSQMDKNATEMKHKLDRCDNELFIYTSSLKAMEDLYTRIKETYKTSLEESLTDTINTWYDEDVKLKFIYQGTSTKTKRAVKLIDEVKGGVQLSEITGDAAKQTVGLLVAVCIARMRGLKFICLDEPFSNFSEETARKVPELLNTLVSDMQILLIENKETVLQTIDAYGYTLTKSTDKNNPGTLIKSIDNEHLYQDFIIEEGDTEDERPAGTI